VKKKECAFLPKSLKRGKVAKSPIIPWPSKGGDPRKEGKSVKLGKKTKSGEVGRRTVIELCKKKDPDSSHSNRAHDISENGLRAVKRK